MSNLNKIAAALPLLAACAERPIGTEYLTDEQHDAVEAAILADGDDIQVAVGLLPYLDTKWDLEGEPVKNSDPLEDGLNRLKDRLLERLEEDRIVVGFDEYWTLYVGGKGRAAAHGANTEIPEDDYIVIAMDEDASTGLSTLSGDFSHEEVHYDYGEHKETVPQTKKGYLDKEKISAYIEKTHDTPYLTSELATAGDILIRNARKMKKIFCRQLHGRFFLATIKRFLYSLILDFLRKIFRLTSMKTWMSGKKNWMIIMMKSWRIYFGTIRMKLRLKDDLEFERDFG